MGTLEWTRDEVEQSIARHLDDLYPLPLTQISAPAAASVLRDVEQLSTEETADALGISVPAVKSRLLRARLRLREKLNRFFEQRKTA